MQNREQVNNKNSIQVDGKETVNQKGAYQSEVVQTKIDIKPKTQQQINKETKQCSDSLKNGNAELETKFQQFSEKLETMISQIQKRKRDLDIYFQKAGTNHKQVSQGLINLQNALKNIKQDLTKQGINLYILNSTFTFLLQYLGQKEYEELDNFQKAVMAMDLDSKVTCCFELLQGSLTMPLDITTEPKQKYMHAWKKIKFQVCGNKQKVADDLLYMKKMMGITTSAVLNQQQQKGAFTKAVAFGLSFPQYFFSDRESQLRSFMFYRKPTIEMAQNIWNLPENGMIRQVVKLSMKTIKTNIKIYIPQPQSQLPNDIMEKNYKSTQVRILYNGRIYRKNKEQQNKGNFFSLSCCGGSGDATPDDIKTVILHIHGGGFVALSSRSMQTYTRKWARQLNVPIFSIDYRKPPSHRFPTAPYDCLNLYSFLVNHIHKYFNIKPNKIILAGDSAGGNLACSLMGLILKHRLPPPKGIFVAYPACDLRRIFSPSRIYSFSDPLLNPPMLLLCLNEYLHGNTEHQTDPLASPVLLTEQFVKGTKDDQRFPVDWPKTIVQVGAKDPLYDDSLRLVQRMVSSNIQCECQVYQNLSHGFLNLDFIVPDCTKTIEDSIEHLKKLLK